jgi:hypothetical protein
MRSVPKIRSFNSTVCRAAVVGPKRNMASQAVVRGTSHRIVARASQTSAREVKLGFDISYHPSNTIPYVRAVRLLLKSCDSPVK